jgi:hypothetical protein
MKLPTMDNVEVVLVLLSVVVLGYAGYKAVSTGADLLTSIKEGFSNTVDSVTGAVKHAGAIGYSVVSGGASAPGAAANDDIQGTVYDELGNVVSTSR